MELPRGRGHGHAREKEVARLPSGKEAPLPLPRGRGRGLVREKELVRLPLGKKVARGMRATGGEGGAATHGRRRRL